MIEIKNLTFSYNDQEDLALTNIYLTVEKGEFILLAGVSGSGKSTLIRLMNGLIPNFYGGKLKGKVNVAGYDVLQYKTRELATTIGMVFQNPDNQVFMSTVEREIAFGLENLNVSPEQIGLDIDQILHRLRISHLKSRPLNTLSGGEKQKVALAAILVMKPSILVLDEPTSELDPSSAKEFCQFLTKLNQIHHTTIILIEHRLKWVLPHLSRIIILEGGKIQYDDSPLKIVQQLSPSDGIELPPLVKIVKNIISSSPRFSNFPLLTSSALKNFIHRFLQTDSKISKFKNKRYHKPSKGSEKSDLHIKVKDLSYSYDESNPVLRNINFNAYGGQLIGLVGKNGAGKTTFLQLLNGLLSPTSGSVIINDVLIENVSVSQLAHQIGYVFQNPAIQFYRDTVLEEIRSILKNFNYKKNQINQKITQLLEQFQLGPYKYQYPRHLSVGQQQRLALAMTVATNPSILLLDEPTHGMDNLQKKSFYRILEHFRQKGHLIIIASHDIEGLAKIASHIVVLEDGQISSSGVCREILSSHPKFATQTATLLKELTGSLTSIITPEDFWKVI